MLGRSAFMPYSTRISTSCINSPYLVLYLHPHLSVGDTVTVCGGAEPKPHSFPLSKLWPMARPHAQVYQEPKQTFAPTHPGKKKGKRWD